MRLMAIPGEKDGVFSEYCTHAASMTFKLPDNVSTMEGGLMEPLAVVMHACELSNAKLGETAVVLGAGCIGLVTLMSLKARGSARYMWRTCWISVWKRPRSWGPPGYLTAEMRT